MKTFKHSGALGDIVFALPVVRHLGPGILYLADDVHLTPASVESISGLLRLQPYIADVRVWRGEAIDYDLDRYREFAVPQYEAGFQGPFVHVCDAHLRAFEVPPDAKDAPWLRVDRADTLPGKDLVVARSARYHGNWLYYKHEIEPVAHRAVFVGLPKEHEYFEYTMRFAIDFAPCPTVLDMARLIAGAKRFIGNFSMPHAIAEAMKKELVCEYFRPVPSQVLERQGARYV